MRRIIALLFIALVTLTGCGQTLKLDSKWSPLLQIEEAPGKLVQPGVTTTIDETSYVNKLSDWLQLYPNGSIAQNAVLWHEREHVKRQHAFPGGPAAWVAKYLVDRAFRWQEEQAGWRLEISYHINHVEGVDASEIASMLNTNYGPVGGRMVSYADALAFVQSVIANPTPTPD